MKNRIVRALLTIVTVAIIGGCNTIKVEDTIIDRTYIDMNTITSYSGTAAGLQLNTMDGNGYYLEVSENVKDTMVQTYYIESESDYDSFMDVLETRDGKIIIEVSNGSVLDNEGNGTDSLGFYRRYDCEKFCEGDIVQSVFIYNPNSNSLDDIVYRMDRIIE